MRNLHTKGMLFLVLCIAWGMVMPSVYGQTAAGRQTKKSGNKMSAQRYRARRASLDQRKMPAWLDQARFGIFPRRGVYALPSRAPAGDMNVYARYAEWYWRTLPDQERQGHDQFVSFHQQTYGKDCRYQGFAPMLQAEMFEPAAWADAPPEVAKAAGGSIAYFAGLRNAHAISVVGGSHSDRSPASL